MATRHCKKNGPRTASLTVSGINAGVSSAGLFPMCHLWAAHYPATSWRASYFCLFVRTCTCNEKAIPLRSSAPGYQLVVYDIARMLDTNRSDSSSFSSSPLVLQTVRSILRACCCLSGRANHTHGQDWFWQEISNLTIMTIRHPGCLRIVVVGQHAISG